MGIDEPGDHRLASQIDDTRLLPRKCLHLLVSADPYEPPIGHGDRLRDAERTTDRHHIAVHEDKVDRRGRRRLGGSDGATEKNENGRYGKTRFACPDRRVHPSLSLIRRVCLGWLARISGAGTQDAEKQRAEVHTSAFGTIRLISLSRGDVNRNGWPWIRMEVQRL